MGCDENMHAQLPDMIARGQCVNGICLRFNDDKEGGKM